VRTERHNSALNVLYISINRKYPTYYRHESRLVVARRWRREEWVHLFNGYKASVWSVENIPELGNRLR
jgi:hypothetical protein